MEQDTTSVLGYIKFCIDIITMDKQIWIYPNAKSWIKL